jgi:hypothetical protein
MGNCCRKGRKKIDLFFHSRSANPLVHGPCLDQHYLVVTVKSGQELVEFLRGRRVGTCDRRGDVGNLVHNTPADGLVDRIPGGKETVDVRRAHAEFGGDVSHRGPMVTHAAKLLLRSFQDPRAGLVEIFSHSHRTIHRIDRRSTRQPLLFAIPVPR